MHRKHIRRWHKLLSVSGILFTVIAGVSLPMANAAGGDSTPIAIYGSSPYSNGPTQVQYIDFPGNVSGLAQSDFYFSGSATGCMLYPVPNITAFSFSITVTNCSDGTFNLNLKANSVTDSNGATGPEYDFKGATTEINSKALQLEYFNQISSSTTSKVEWQVTSNHLLATNSVFDATVNGSGCNLTQPIVSGYLMKIVAEGCNDGSQVSLSINIGAISDVYGNAGPGLPMVSEVVMVSFPMHTATPTPTATTTPTPTPTATPTAQPTPSSTPTAESVVAVVAPPPPPAEPPTPPQPPVIEQQPVAQPVVEAPVIDLPEQSVVPVEAITESLAQIVETRKALVPSPAEPIEAPVVLPVRPTPVVRQISQRAESSLNWQPLGYLAIGLGGASGAVGATLMLKRFLRVKRYRFS